MLIRRMKLERILSFKDTTVELGQLNVLIGPNAVGKSNLIEAISLLRATPSSLANEMLRGGGVRQWIWLGDRVASPIASLQCEIVLPIRLIHPHPLSYQLKFSEDAQGFLILAEQLSDTAATPHVYFERSHNRVSIRVAGRLEDEYQYETAAMPGSESVFSRFKNPFDTSPTTAVGSKLENIRIFREFRTGPASQTRLGNSTSVPKNALTDGGDNLALVLSELNFLGVHERIRYYLKRFCERFEDVKVRVGDGVAQAFLLETGLSEALSAIRMSDGTLKFLCLLAALFHPTPPPLMCIEEPELGLHPEALQLVAEALIEASETMQLVVTTHSDALIDWLSDRPEAVLVCERDFDNGTQFTRLSKDKLREWLQHYTLGELWRKGEVGGGRW